MKKLIEIDDEKQAVVPRELLEAAIEYMEYKHSGDPWEEDARAMGEMWLDVLKSVRGIEYFRELLAAPPPKVKP